VALRAELSAFIRVQLQGFAPLSGPHPKTLISSLALSVAAGKAVAAWARENKIPVRTAYEWHARPGFRRAVERYRRRYLDRTLGLLAKGAAESVAEEIRLAKEGEDEAIRLHAARGVVADMISVWRFAEMERRVNELERRHRERSDEPGDPN